MEPIYFVVLVAAMFGWGWAANQFLRQRFVHFFARWANKEAREYQAMRAIYIALLTHRIPEGRDTILLLLQMVRSHLSERETVLVVNDFLQPERKKTSENIN